MGQKDELIRNLWGSEENLRSIVKDNIDECVRRGVQDEIGTIPFKRAIIGSVRVSRDEFALALKIISATIEKIRKEQNEQNATRDNDEPIVTRKMIEDARRQEWREVKRAGGRESYNKTMFR